MYRSLRTKLFSQYFVLLTLVFVLFIVSIIWGLKFSYNKAIEHSLSNIANSIESKIITAYFFKNTEIKLTKDNSPFKVKVFESIDGKHKLIMSSTDDNIKLNSNYLTEGFHVKLLDTKQYYALYNKTFKVHKHTYHIVVSVEFDSYFATEKLYFFWAAIVTGFLYLILLYGGYIYVRYLIAPIRRMIEELSSSDEGSGVKLLSLPKGKGEFYTLSTNINSLLKKFDTELTNTKRFNATLSHELRTPLTIIRGEIEVALHRDRSIKEYKELLFSALEEVDALQNITDNMLLLTKINLKTSKIKKLYVRLDKVIEEAIASLKIEYEVKSIQVHTSLESITYFMEEVLMQQSIRNLLSNAIKYSPNNTHINIVLRTDEKYIIFEIQDEGYGISNEDMSKIFEPHFRAKNKVLENIAGEGLGLTIVQHTLQLHDATLSVDSTLGKGSNFIIEFKN